MKFSFASKGLRIEKGTSLLGHAEQRIKLRIFIPLILSIGVLLLSFILALNRDQHNRDQEYIIRSARELQNMLRVEQAEKSATMSTALQAILNDEQLANALRARDRKALFVRALPLHEALKSRHQITHFYFHGPDRVNLLRVHQTDRHSDFGSPSTVFNIEWVCGTPS